MKFGAFLMATTLMTTTISAVSLTGAARADEGIEGTWKSAGYGMIIKIGRDGATGKRTMTTEESVQGSCLLGDSLNEVKDDNGTVYFGDDGDSELTVRLDGDHALYHELGSADGVDIRLNPLRGDPPECPSKPPPGKSPQEHAFDVFWQTFREHYPPFDHRDEKALSQDRHDADLKTLKASNTDATLDTLLRGVVTDLHDGHTCVKQKKKETCGLREGTRDSADQDEGLIGTAVKTRIANLGGSLTQLIKDKDGNDLVSYAEGLPGGLGYLRITAFEGLAPGGTADGNRAAFTKALNTVFDHAKKWQGLILDMRLNDGGDDSLGLELASRLTGTGHYAYKKRARDTGDPSGFTPFQDVTVQGTAGAFGKPVAVLVSDMTVSAGETTTMALQNRSPAPILIGRQTEGIYSDQLQRSLPGGKGSFSLTNEDYRTRDGGSYEGTGIPVGTTTPVFEPPDNLKNGCDSAIAVAVDALNGKGTTPACPAA